MINKLKNIGLILVTIGASQNAFAHAGIENNSILHSVLHLAFSGVVAIALIVASVFLIKRFPQVMKLKIKK